jgi:hypothetical protein
MAAMKALRWLESVLRLRSRSQELEDLGFDNLEAADRIVVTTNLNETICTVDDPTTIQAVLAFVKGHRSGWTVPEDGVPIARLRLNFYTSDRPLGNVGVGHTFLTALQYGSFWAKASDEAERARLLDIIGLEE